MSAYLIEVMTFWCVWGALHGVIPDALGARLNSTEGLHEGRYAWLQRIWEHGRLRPYQADAWRAGFRTRWAPLVLIGIHGAGISVIFLGMSVVFADLSFFVMSLCAGLALVLGTLVYRGLVLARIRRYQARLFRDLLGFMTIMALCLEAGLGLHAALVRACRPSRSGRSALQGHIDIVLRSLSHGEGFPQAMKRALEGIDAGPVRQFFDSLIHVERLGGGVLNILKSEIQATIEIRRHEARERASKASIELMVPLILFQLPALLILLLAPVLIPFAMSLEQLL